MTAFVGGKTPLKIFIKEMGCFDITIQARKYSSVYLTQNFLFENIIWTTPELTGL